ncbi:hypothetical protein TDB9533_01139 [Thalassocella blandensis]|nr:hypothetical protein TDB9533_01139 [Thalassocella blandensis]
MVKNIKRTGLSTQYRKSLLASLICGVAVMFSAPLVVAQSGMDKPKKIENTPFSEFTYLQAQPRVDGVLEKQWESLPWFPLDQLMVGSVADKDDFSGRFKIGWRKEGLYLVAEIVDDKLIDQYADPLVQYWDDDTLEVFVDEDQSGGLHKTSYNAFAYHIGLDNQSADIDDEGNARLYNDHVVSQWRRHKNTIVWEAFIKLYDDSFDHRKQNAPVKLKAGKKIGFMLAYCDNDNSPEREHFYGSTFIEGQDKNQGWINASVFTPVTLVK